MSKFFHLFTLVLCCVLASGADVTESIAETVNEYIKDLSTEEITEKIEFHYKLLGLIDDNGDWVHQYFKTCPSGAALFPR